MLWRKLQRSSSGLALDSLLYLDLLGKHDDPMHSKTRAVRSDVWFKRPISNQVEWSLSLVSVNYFNVRKIKDILRLEAPRA